MSVDSNNTVTHLADHRRDQTDADPVAQMEKQAGLRVATMLRDFFTEQKALLERQNALLERQNVRLEEKVSRLLVGMDRLLGEVDAVRNGQQDEAFARIARHDEAADLPTIQADAAVIYPYTSGDIGEQLGLSATQIGTLLGRQGLGWGGKGEYEETTRWKPGRQRYWHKDVPDKLANILLTREPDEFGITNRAIRTMFTRYRTRAAARSAEAATTEPS